MAIAIGTSETTSLLRSHRRSLDRLLSYGFVAPAIFAAFAIAVIPMGYGLAFSPRLVPTAEACASLGRSNKLYSALSRRLALGRIRSHLGLDHRHRLRRINSWCADRTATQPRISGITHSIRLNPITLGHTVCCARLWVAIFVGRRCRADPGRFENARSQRNRVSLE